MLLCRTIAVLFLIATLGLFAYEIVGVIIGGSYNSLASGELWARVHANSLVGFQALIEKNTFPWLWREVLLPILLAPAWAITALPGLFIILLCHTRRRR